MRNSMRFALLAYGRNDAKGLVYHALRNLGGTVTFQADFLFKIGNLEQLFQHSTQHIHFAMFSRNEWYHCSIIIHNNIIYDSWLDICCKNFSWRHPLAGWLGIQGKIQGMGSSSHWHIWHPRYSNLKVDGHIPYILVYKDPLRITTFWYLCHLFWP